MISDNENVTVDDAVGNIMRCSKLSWSMHSKRRSCSIYNRPAILSTTKTTHMHQHRVVTRCWLIRSATAVAAHSSSVYYNIRILSTLWVNKQGATPTMLWFCIFVFVRQFVHRITQKVVHEFWWTSLEGWNVWWSGFGSWYRNFLTEFYHCVIGEFYECCQ